jgi:hypothetical protein
MRECVVCGGRFLPAGYHQGRFLACSPDCGRVLMLFRRDGWTLPLLRRLLAIVAPGYEAAPGEHAA